jgi:tight adherence protein B
MGPTILIIVGASLTVLFVIMGLASSSRGREARTYDKLLGRVRGDGRVSAAKSTDAPSLRRDGHDSGIRLLDTLIKQFLPRPAVLRARLERTGLRISPGEYLLFSIIVGLLFGFLSAQFFGRAIILSALSGFTSGLAVPHCLVKWLIARRLTAFTGQFPEAIDLIVRGLKSGLPVPASMPNVAAEIEDPVGAEFRLISDRIRIGETLEDALRLAADRVPTPEFRFFVTALAVQRETGGNLAETLENLSDVLRKRRQMKLKIKAMSAEAKASAIILGSLPFVMFSIMMLTNSDYAMEIFIDPRGLIMVGIGFFSLFIGIIVMAKMVRFEV